MRREFKPSEVAGETNVPLKALEKWFEKGFLRASKYPRLSWEDMGRVILFEDLNSAGFSANLAGRIAANILPDSDNIAIDLGEDIVQFSFGKYTTVQINASKLRADLRDRR